MKHQSFEPKQEPPYFDENGSFEFRPVSSDARLAVSLSRYPEALVYWLEEFTTNCAFGCCGLSALGFPPATGWDKRWRYDPRIMKMLQAVRDEVENAPSDVLWIPDFQKTMYKQDALV